MKKTSLLLIAALVLCYSKCGLVDEFDGFIVKNNSGHPVAIYIADKIQSDASVYPDTTLPANYSYVKFIDSGPTDFYWQIRLSSKGYSSLADYFKKNLPVDTLSVYFFHPDTLTKYSWEKVREDYMILKRYDMSLENLQYLDKKTVNYPPTESMKNIKQYPPYEE